jgi:hypothetical protein
LSKKSVLGAENAVSEAKTVKLGIQKLIRSQIQICFLKLLVLLFVEKESNKKM